MLHIMPMLIACCCCCAAASPVMQQAYASIAEQCWQADAEARPSFVQLVAALDGLLQQHETLQREVDKGTRRIGTW